MMLERIQQSMQGPIMKVVLFIIIIFFVFAGYFTGTLFSGNPDKVAEVEGAEITNAQIQQRVDRVRQQMGQQFDQQYATEASQQLLREQIKQQLINEQIIRANLNKAGLTASEEQIKKWIRSFPDFQIGGIYSPERAKSALINSGLTEERFRQYVRQEIAQEQLNKGVGASNFALDYEVEAFYRLQEQARHVRYVRISQEDFADSIEVTDTEIEEYYQQNQAQFEQPEKVNLRYVRLSIDQLTEAYKAQITEEQIQQFYDNNKNSYQDPAEILVAHILIENTVDDAEAKANDILNQIKGGADFAEMAKEHSSDTFSAENGGQLDWVDAVASDDNATGTGWVPEFEQAALALSDVGAMTDVVETQYGYHIIKLVDKKEAEVSSLADVADDIRESLAQDKAQEEFFAKQSKLNENLFEYGDDLDKFAEQVGLDVQETGLFSEDSATGIAANPVFLEKAFSASILESSEVSDMIELTNNDIVYVTVKDYQPAQVQPLEEVKETVVATLKEDKVRNATKEFADQVLTRLEEDGDADTLLSMEGLSWSETSGLKRRDTAIGFDMTNAIFNLKAPAEGEVSRSVETLFNGDFAVIEVKAVNYPDVSTMDDATRQQIKQRLANAYAQGEMQSLMQSFRDKADISE
ncbi:SurA N-terminal domain-containing protein [Kangiella sp.]|uniref:SurA N-terminal domain-containing protein n=1 Tax=Kangiella sp. TaxID=1920245 RepID=UPI00198CF8A8|nr:SurA N-terminal domain-containing protein [Kangiella sp.]MBD3654445.1 SurA N-terminal domain-containing protein [Kangiella sp.]